MHVHMCRWGLRSGACSSMGREGTLARSCQAREEQAPGCFPSEAREPSPGGGVRGKAGVPHHPSGVSLLLAPPPREDCDALCPRAPQSPSTGRCPVLATSPSSGSRARCPPLFSVAHEGFTQTFAAGCNERKIPGETTFQRHCRSWMNHGPDHRGRATSNAGGIIERRRRKRYRGKA